MKATKENEMTMCGVKHPRGTTTCQHAVGHKGPHNGGNKVWAVDPYHHLSLPHDLADLSGPVKICPTCATR